MRKIFISIFLISFIFNFVNAEEIKQTKQVKETKKKELSKEDEEFLKEMERLDKESKKIEETRKTLDEIKNKLNVKWKKDYKKNSLFFAQKIKVCYTRKNLKINILNYGI